MVRTPRREIGVDGAIDKYVAQVSGCLRCTGAWGHMYLIRPKTGNKCGRGGSKIYADKISLKSKLEGNRSRATPRVHPIPLTGWVF